MVITFEEIKTLVPQKYPFLMVDRVLSLEPGKRVVAIKNITGNEIFFLGHFPNMAVMPGALIIERWHKPRSSSSARVRKRTAECLTTTRPSSSSGEPKFASSNRLSPAINCRLRSRWSKLFPWEA